jgi:hypothetical protein
MTAQNLPILTARDIIFDEEPIENLWRLSRIRSADS